MSASRSHLFTRREGAHNTDCRRVCIDLSADLNDATQRTNNLFASAYSETIGAQSSYSLVDMPSGTVLVHDVVGKIGLILKS